MYALLVEVNANESHVELARKMLPEQAVPLARELGARAGHWLAPVDGRGVAVLVFDDEQHAQAAAARFQVGAPAGPVPDVTVRTVEVREVLAVL